MSGATFEATRRALDLAKVSLEAVDAVLDSLGDGVLTKSELVTCQLALERVVTQALVVAGNLPMLAAQSERDAVESCSAEGC